MPHPAQASNRLKAAPAIRRPGLSTPDSRFPAPRHAAGAARAGVTALRQRMNQFTLAGRGALVTGGTKGIGLAIVRQLLKLGSTVVTCGECLSRPPPLRLFGEPCTCWARTAGRTAGPRGLLPPSQPPPPCSLFFAVPPSPQHKPGVAGGAAAV